MKKKNRNYTYLKINFLFGITASLYFIKNWNNIFVDVGIGYAISIIGIAVLVHGIKIVRMYFIFAGENISFKEHALQYCKCVPVSMILPFKVGDLFKIYCYGYILHNFLKSTITVLLDRFVDIFALMTVSFLIRVVQPYKLTTVEYLLIIFLSLIVICYYSFPGLYQYWNRFLIRTRAKKINMVLLEWLDILEGVYLEVSRVCKMRFIILYMLSLTAWGIEMIGFLMFCKLRSETNVSEEVSNYLRASLTGGNNYYLQQFVFIGTVILLSLYVVLKIKNNRSENLELYMRCSKKETNE